MCSPWQSRPSPEINDLTALRRQGYGLFAAKIWFKSQAAGGRAVQAVQGLETAQCPFTNLPEANSGRWGEGLTAAKMTECRWLVPRLVGGFEFLEWTPDGRLRHVRFCGLRDDARARDVWRES
jgi:hypothetical protein